MSGPLKAYRYGGQTFLKFGSKKSTPGVMYPQVDLAAGLRPDVELWRDGTVTYHGRPEGDIDQMKRVALPAWAYMYEVKSFKSRS